MHIVEKKILLPYTVEQMFTLVSSVEDYPKFLPWCASVEVFERTPEMLDSKIHLQFKGIKQFFRTHNVHTYHPTNAHIQMTFLEGPFKCFEGSWQFTALDEYAVKVEFKLNYEFNSKLLELVVGPVFKIISNTFVESFVAEAKRIYI